MYHRFAISDWGEEIQCIDEKTGTVSRTLPRYAVWDNECHGVGRKAEVIETGNDLEILQRKYQDSFVFDTLHKKSLIKSNPVRDIFYDKESRILEDDDPSNTYRTVASFGGEYQFVDASQDVVAIKEHFAGSINKFNKRYDNYGAFFVIVGDGDYDEVWGINGNIPYNWKIAYLVEFPVDKGLSTSEANPRKHKFTSPYRVDTWFERDRASIAVYDANDKEIAKWWDKDVQQMIDFGFFMANRGEKALENSVITYLKEQGVI